MFKTLLRQLGELKNILWCIYLQTLGNILCQRAKSAPSTHKGDYYEAHSGREIE